MPTAWRIVKRRHASTAFDGEGARLFGGRWNRPGTAVVYLSESRALAMLEVLAGLGGAAPLGAWVLIPARFDNSLVERLDPSTLPPEWRAHPPPHPVQAIGDRWVEEARSVALKVPSALVPAESNLLLNPGHPEFDQVEIGPEEAIDFDPRLGRR